MTNTDGEPVINRVNDVQRAWYLLKESQQLLQLGKAALASVAQAAPPELPRLPPFTIFGNS